MCPDYDCRNNIRKLYKSKQGLSNHVLNMHSSLVESVKSNILKEYYGKVSTESNKICIYSVMQTERGGYEFSMVESDDESCGSGNGSESESVLGEVILSVFAFVKCVKCIEYRISASQINSQSYMI